MVESKWICKISYFKFFCIAETLSKTFTDDTNVNVSHGNPLQVKLLWPHYIEHL